MLNFIKDYICSNANWASMTLFRKQYAHATIACIPVVPLSLGLRVSGLSPAKNLGSSIAGHDRLRLRREWKVESSPFDGNGKLKKKPSCFQFSTSQLMGDYLFT